jgi:hypothetical protein
MVHSDCPAINAGRIGPADGERIPNEILALLCGYHCKGEEMHELAVLIHA